MSYTITDRRSKTYMGNYRKIKNSIMIKIRMTEQ